MDMVAGSHRVQDAPAPHTRLLPWHSNTAELIALNPPSPPFPIDHSIV